MQMHVLMQDTYNFVGLVQSQQCRREFFGKRQPLLLDNGPSPGEHRPQPQAGRHRDPPICLGGTERDDTIGKIVVAHGLTPAGGVR